MKFRVQIHYHFKGRCLSEPMEVHADSHEDAARQVTIGPVRKFGSREDVAAKVWSQGDPLTQTFYHFPGGQLMDLK